MAKNLRGIRPAPGGTRITIYTGGKGKAVYDKTHSWDFYKASELKQAISFREKLQARAKLGLPLFENQESLKREFWTVAQSYLNSVAVDRTTRADYKSKLNRHCIPYIGGYIFEEISRQQIVDMVGRWERLQPSSKNAVLRVLRSVFKYGGRYADNPAVGVSGGRSRKGNVDRYRPDERDAVLSKLEGHALAFFSIFFGTGMRPGEIVALNWGDWDGTYLQVTKQITRGSLKNCTKTKIDRRVYVPKWVRPAMNTLDTRMKGERLFPVRRFEEYYPAWREAHQKARIGAYRVRYRRPYTCRHTRAAELLSNGVLPAQAARELGHGVKMFLDTYSEFIEEFSQMDMSKLEGNPRETCEKSVTI